MIRVETDKKFRCRGSESLSGLNGKRKLSGNVFEMVEIMIMSGNKTVDFRLVQNTKLGILKSALVETEHVAGQINSLSVYTESWIIGPIGRVAIAVESHVQ